MRIGHVFSFKRFFLLIKKDCYTQYKTYLMALGAIFGVLFVVKVASVASAQSWNFNLVFYPLTLFIGGFVFTSLSFSELYQEQSRIFYITIPASGPEKFISKLLMTSLVYVVVSLLLYFLFSLIVFILTTLIFGMAYPVLDPFHPVVLRCIRIYLVTQSIFLCGAIYFNKNAFLKTILFLFVFALGYILFIAGIVYLFYRISSFHQQFHFSFKFYQMLFQENTPVPPFLHMMKNAIDYSSQLFFWYLLAPLMWIVSFFRLKEIEV